MKNPSEHNSCRYSRKCSTSRWSLAGCPAHGLQQRNPGPCSRSVAFRLRRNRAAGHRPHRGRCFAVPVAAAPRRGPNGNTPALFGYFLNIKKVTPSADFVISPAKAGAFRFVHTRLPLSPRPLLPFGRISPAAKPRVRLPAPPFGFAAQKRARHFAARNHPGRCFGLSCL